MATDNRDIPNTLKDVQVFINDIQLDSQAYNTLSIVGDIDFIYNGGALVINDVSGTFSDSAALRIGDLIKIVLLFEEINSTTPKNITTEMCIHSIHQDDEHKKTYDNGGGYYIYKLISPAFYSQVPANRGYNSSTSDIIRKEVNLIKWYSTNVSTDKSLTIAQSDDSSSRRFLLNERPLSFIKKIAMKASIDKSASLCYVDEFNGFNFVSLKSKLQAKAKFSLVPPVTTGSNTYSPIIMEAFNIRLFENLDSWNTQKIRFNKIDIAKNKVTSSTMESLLTSQTEVYLNNLVLKDLKFTTQYAAPADGNLEQEAMSLQYQKDQLHNYVIEVLTYDAIGKIKTGDVVELTIPSSVAYGESNSYSGNYIVKRCEHKIENLQSRSSLILVKVSTKTKSWTVKTASPSSSSAKAATPQ
jgi:hypothetical protein